MVPHNNNKNIFIDKYGTTIIWLGSYYITYSQTLGSIINHALRPVEILKDFIDINKIL